MVAKGHDFPEVTLSAIVDADATLRFPDFRADERTFAMVAQLAGRSGRGEAGGRGDRPDPGARALPASPTPPATTPPASSAVEIERRRALRYPPFSHLVRVVLRVRVRGAARRRGQRRSPSRLAETLPDEHRPARPGADVPASAAATAAGS